MGITLFNLATADLWDEVGKTRMGRLDENEDEARKAFFGYRTRSTTRPPSTRPTWSGAKGTRVQSFHFRHTTVSKPSNRLLTRHLRCDAPRSSSATPALDFHVYASKLDRAEGVRREEVLYDHRGAIEVTNIGATIEEAAAFWNAVEGAERRDGRVQSRLTCEIPAELEPSDVRELLRHFADVFWDHGLAFYAVVHRPGLFSDRRNVHAHILYHDRAAWPDGVGGWQFAPTKAEEVRAGTWIPRLRERWAESANRMLEIVSYRSVEAGGEAVSKRYDPRSFAEVGVRKTPTMHLGPKWAALERAGVPTRIGAANAERELRWQMIGEPNLRREAATAVVAAAIDGVARDAAEAGESRAAEVAAARCLDALDGLAEAHGRLEQVLETTVPDLVLSRAYRHHDDMVGKWLSREVGRLAVAARRARSAEEARQAGRAAPRGRALDAVAAYDRGKAAFAMRVSGCYAGLTEPRKPRPLPHTADGRPRGSDEEVRAIEQRFEEAARAVEQARLELQLVGHAARLAEIDGRRRVLAPLRVARMRPQEAEQVRAAASEYAQASAAAAAAQRTAEAARAAAEEEERWLAALRARQAATEEAAAEARTYGSDLRRWFAGLYRDGGDAAMAQLTAWGRGATPPTAPMVSAAMEPGGLGLTVRGVDPDTVDADGQVGRSPQKRRAAVAWVYARVVRQEQEGRLAVEAHLAAAPERVLPTAAGPALVAAREALEAETRRHGEALVAAARELWRTHGGLRLPSVEEMAAVVANALPREERASLLGPVRSAMGLTAVPPRVTDPALTRAAGRRTAKGTSAAAVVTEPSIPATEQPEKAIGHFVGACGQAASQQSTGLRDASEQIIGLVRERHASSSTSSLSFRDAVKGEGRVNSEALPAANNETAADSSSAPSMAPGASLPKLVPLRISPGSEVTVLETLRGWSTKYLKEIGIHTAIEIDANEANIGAQGVTRRRIEARAELSMGLKMIRLVLSQRNEKMPEHRRQLPPRASNRRRGLERG